MSVTVEPNLNVSREESTGISLVGSLYWDTNTLAWVKAESPSGTTAVTQSGTWNIGTVTEITNPVTVTGTVGVTSANIDVAISTRLSESAFTAVDFATSAKQTTAQTTLDSIDTSLSELTVYGVVSDTTPAASVGDVQALSLSTDGRLRVLSMDAPIYIELFRSPAPFFNTPKLTSADSGPWALDQCNPWA